MVAVGDCLEKTGSEGERERGWKGLVRVLGGRSVL